MKIDDKLSPNHDDRGHVKPSLIILHYTGMQTDIEVYKKFRDPDSKVSSHYTVDEAGSVHHHVDEERRAWHAGASFWQGETDINAHSIGIEIVNPGHEFGYRPFPADQMRAVAALCKDIMARHKIKPASVLAHSDIAPSRKEDPGELFDWKMLAGQGVGVWPDADAEDRAKGISYQSDENRLREALGRYGYDTRCATPVLLRAFQRHFHPEVFGALDSAGVMTAETATRLAALLRISAL